jgi:signal transduction histidine kinase
LRQNLRYQDARYRAYRVLQMANQINRPEYIAWAQYMVGATSHWDTDYTTALKYLHKALQSNPRTGDALRSDIYRQLSLTYAVLDSLQQAQHYALRYGDLSDTLLNRSREHSLQQLQARYDITDKRAAISNLKLEKKAVEKTVEEQRFTAGILAVGLGVLLLALLFYRHRLRTNRVIAAQNEEINRRHIRELEDALKIETMQSMLAGQESERQRIAQDLHDSVGGLLAASKIQLENISAKNAQLAGTEDFAKMRNLIDETVAETRHISRNMQPSALLEFGLVIAVRDLTGRVQGKGHGAPTISFHHIGDFSAIDQTTALNCYRIVQELLQNSLKHARASEILVQLTQTDHQIALLVEDDGAGFDPAAVKKGMGTDNIARRVHFLKGELSIHAAPGKGTSTLVTIPA